MMPYCRKIEYYVYEGDEVTDWLDSEDEALSRLTDPTVTKIERVKHYLDDHEIVWERDGEEE